MEKLSLTLIVIFLVAGLLLAGCGMEQTPEPSIIPTESKSTPTHVPTATPQPSQKAATAEPTLAPTETNVPELIDELSELAVISADNVGELAFIRTESLDPESEELNFTAFDWSQDGTLIVTCTHASERSSFQVFDLVAGSIISEVEIDSDVCTRLGGGMSMLKFSRDGRIFFGVKRSIYDIGASGDTQIGIFNSATGEQISELEGLSKLPAEIFSLYAAAFSSQGTRLAIIIYEHAIPASTQDASVEGGAWIDPACLIELYDVESGAHWGSFHKQKFLDAVDLAYSTEGEYLVFGVGDFAQAWSVEGEMTYEIDCVFPGITFSPTSEVAALRCGYRKDNFYQLLWNLKTGHSVQIEGTSGVNYHKLSYSMDGRLLIGLSDEGEISIWHGESGDFLFTLPGTYPTAVDAHFIGGGKLVAVLFEDGRLELYGVK